MLGLPGDRHQERGEPDAQGSSLDDALVAYGVSEESTPLLPGRKHRKISPAGYKLIFYGLVALSAILFVIVNLFFHFTRCPLYPSAMDAVRQDWQKEKAQHALFQEEWRLEQHEHSVIEAEWKLQDEWHKKDVAHRIQEENERQERVRREWVHEYERHVREVKEYEEAVTRRVHEEQERQERVREEWDQEGRDHDKEVSRRIREEEERQESVRKVWGLELEVHRQEVARRIHEEEERRQGVRKEWDLEFEEHEKEAARRIHEEEERRKMAREEWAREAEEHRHQCDEMERRENERRENERQKWRREIEDHDQIVKEREKREEEERLKLNLFWSKAEAHTCTTYATREYTARLMNLPDTWEHPVEACKATPLEVHGISYLPKSCEDKGAGIVIGRWEINRHEPDCATFWNWYKDKGCTSPGSGRRRIEHYMENLPQGGDWREFCATTPARFSGLEFSGAQECFQYKSGTYGHWEIDDVSCQ